MDYLKKTDYISDNSTNLELTGKGLKITVLLFKKFITYIKRNFPEELDSWIKIFDYHKGKSSKLIPNIFHYTQKEYLVEKAFKKYLEDLENIENVDTFEVDDYKLNEVIDDIFINMDEINRLFENKFGFKLFCPPLRAQPELNKATRETKIDFTGLVATIGAILDGICHREIDTLLISKQTGSVNKIKALLEENSIYYDANTIDKLRALHHIRDTTFPVHEAGSKIINHLQKLEISFPIDNYKHAAKKILQSFDSCLLEMKEWFK